MSSGQRAAIIAVEAAMSELGMTQSQLAAAARLNVRIVNSFLTGRNWPQIRTRAAIETALGWPRGTLRRIELGEDPPPPRRTAEELRRLIHETEDELAFFNPRHESTRRVVTAKLRREIEDLKQQLEASEED